MRGKQKCALLKSIRCKIAKENGLNYTLSECTFRGDCKGTCPKCEAELKQLSEDLQKMKQTGKRVAIAGIAAAMVAASASGCTPDHNEEWEVIFVPSEELTGDISFSEEPTDDAVIPEDSGELTGDIVLEAE